MAVLITSVAGFFPWYVGSRTSAIVHYFRRPVVEPR